MRTEKHVIGMLALIASTSLIYQNCGSGFGANQASTDFSSASQAVVQLSKVDVTIVPSGTGMVADADLSFTVSGSIPPDATFAWSNTNNSNSICAEQSSPAAKTYTVRCLSAGTVLVTVAVIEQGQIVGSSSATYAVGMPSATPTPTPSPTPTGSPTPIPSPMLLQGQTIYATSCANCHNAIAISSIRYTSVEQVTAVITGNLGNMHNTTAMKTLIMTDAADVADLIALIYALEN